MLGTVGSSGSSTGPHLHFELHDAAGQVVDPYAGSCGSKTSFWAVQKPYYEPTINTLMTHQQAPVFATCPQQHVPNNSDNLRPGETAYFAAYYHDQQQNQLSTYTIYRPDNSIFAAWKHSMSAEHYSASYWYWSLQMPTAPVSGTWRFVVSFQGATVTHKFTVGATATASTMARPAAYSLYPNPAHHRATLVLAASPTAGAEVLIRNQVGQVVSRQPLAAQRTQLALPVTPGLYLITLPTTDGPITQKLLVE